MRVIHTNTPMYVTQDSVISRLFECTAELSRILHVCQSDRAIAFESKVNQVEVLRKNRCCWTGKVQGERILYWSQIVEFEYEVFRKMGFVTPYYPANTNIAQTKFMTTAIWVSFEICWRLGEYLRGVDGNNAWKLEIPNQFGLRKGQGFYSSQENNCHIHERKAQQNLQKLRRLEIHVSVGFKGHTMSFRITVNGNINSCLCFIFVQEIGHLLDWFVMSSVGACRRCK